MDRLNGLENSITPIEPNGQIENENVPMCPMCPMGDLGRIERIEWIERIE
jgi:hypothetical protein